MNKFRQVTTVAAFCLCIAAFTGKTMAQTTDVYVGGSDNNKATVWKNGTPHYLSDNGVINSVVVNNGDVYAAGYEIVSGKNIAKVWKNDMELYTFSTDISMAQSIAVSENGIIYVAGAELVLGQWVGWFWKNGVGESSYTDAASLRSIFIDGSDIYVAGSTTDWNAAVWKNGDLHYTLSSGGDEEAYSVFVYNGDVYTTGYEYAGNDIYLGKVWKNNATLYTFSGTNDWGNSIYISEGVIYAAGGQYDGSNSIATLWTDGVAAELAGGMNGFSVFVYDGDVYVAGNNNEALLWINGTATTLAIGGSSALSVFVVEKPRYTVTFAGEAIEIEPQSIQEGYLATKPTDPERADYDFGSWFTDNGTFLNEWNFATDVVTQDTTLYAKWTETVGISEIESAGLKIYPNPTKDELRIESGNLAIKQIEVVDLSGKVIYQFNELRNQINVSALSQGIYFVKLDTDKGTVTQKFVKE
jgi:uncharacterized repeat protein (TIGR02543 family)